MNKESGSMPNIQQAVPFFRVSNIAASVRFYVDGLGGEMHHQWKVDGKLRWCWLKLGDAAVMLQAILPDSSIGVTAEEKMGVGVTICFQCRDALALYKTLSARGLSPKRPFVGNGMWVTSLTDPDGYHLEFESFTDVPEETEYTEEA